MIEFNYETEFALDNEAAYAKWCKSIINGEGKRVGEISYVFCDDEYLHKINLEYLQHDNLTDIISFDYTMGDEISGDIFISIERVRDNSEEFKAPFIDELHRVMAHGLLHYCGYKDKSDDDAAIMRKKEEEKMEMFHVEQ